MAVAEVAMSALELLFSTVPTTTLPTAALTKEPDERVGPRYGLINTATVVRCLEEQGFRVVRARDNKKKTGRHAVFLRHEGLYVDNAEYIPEAVILNAHDGSAAFRLAVGLYLPLSGRTLFVGAEWAALRVRHTHNQALELGQALPGLINGARHLANAVGLLRMVTPKEEERRQLARAAIAARWGAKAPIGVEVLLEGLAAHLSLFDLVLAIHTRVLGGGLRTLARGRTRAVKALKTEVAFSQRLFEEALKIGQVAV